MQYYCCSTEPVLNRMGTTLQVSVTFDYRSDIMSEIQYNNYII